MCGRNTHVNILHKYTYKMYMYMHGYHGDRHVRHRHPLSGKRPRVHYQSSRHSGHRSPSDGHHGHETRSHHRHGNTEMTGNGDTGIGNAIQVDKLSAGLYLTQLVIHCILSTIKNRTALKMRFSPYLSCQPSSISPYTIPLSLSLFSPLTFSVYVLITLKGTVYIHKIDQSTVVPHTVAKLANGCNLFHLSY